MLRRRHFQARLLATFIGIVTSTSWAAAQGPYNVQSYGAIPGDGLDDGPAIRSAILAADAGPPGAIVSFPTGVYDVDEQLTGGMQDADKCGLYLYNVEDVTLLGGPDATILFRNRNRHGIMLYKSKNVTIRNLVLNYERACHIEGLITAYSGDEVIPGSIPAKHVPRYTVLLDPYFTTYGTDPYIFASGLPSGHASWLMFAFDAITRTQKRYSAPMTALALEYLPAPPRVHIYLDANVGDLDQAKMNITLNGDVAAITAERRNTTSSYTAGNMIRSIETNNLVVDGVTILRAPMFGGEHVYNTGAEYSDCTITSDPSVNPPYGALISTNRDSLRFIEGRGGPQIIGCRIERCGDDGVNIGSAWHEVIDVSGGGTVATVVHSSFSGETNIKVGDRLEVFSPLHLKYKGRIVVQSPVTPGSPGVLQQFPFSVSDGSAPMQFDLLVNQSSFADGFEIRDNIIRDATARCLLVRGRNGTIVGNALAGSGLSGLLFAAEFETYEEAGFGRTITISGNSIHNSGYYHWGAHPNNTSLGALTVGLQHAQPSWPSGLGHKDFVITNNWISTTRMVGLFLGSINPQDGLPGADVQDNHILASQLDPALAPGLEAGSAHGIPGGSASGVVHLQHVSGVDAQGNTLDTRPFGAPVPELSFPPSPATTGTDGTPLQLQFSLGPNTIGVFSTSFEQAEKWSVLSQALASFSGSYTVPDPNATIAGVPIKFSNWHLFGNDPTFDYYRGHVSSRCASVTGGWMKFSPPSGTIDRIEFWAAAEATTPASTWKLRVQSQSLAQVPGDNWYNERGIELQALPLVPSFLPYSVSLENPEPPINVRFILGAITVPPAVPDLVYVDDVVLHFD